MITDRNTEMKIITLEFNKECVWLYGVSQLNGHTLTLPMECQWILVLVLPGQSEFGSAHNSVRLGKISQLLK